MRKGFLLLSLALLFSLFCGISYADILIDRDGNRYNGEIIEMTDNFVSIQTDTGKIKLNRSEIVSVIKEKYNKKAVTKETEPVSKIQPHSITPEKAINGETSEEPATPKTTQTIEPGNILVPEGVTIPIRFVSRFNSMDYVEGDMVSIIVAENVRVDNKIIFKKGNTGYIVVGKNKGPGIWKWSKGELGIEEGKITDDYGNEHIVSLDIARRKGYNVTKGYSIGKNINTYRKKYYRGIIIPNTTLFHASTSEERVVKIEDTEQNK